MEKKHKFYFSTLALVCPFIMAFTSCMGEGATEGEKSDDDDDDVAKEQECKNGAVKCEKMYVYECEEGKWETVTFCPKGCDDRGKVCKKVEKEEGENGCIIDCFGDNGQIYECGSDGCGGSCGECKSDEYCFNGSCKKEGANCPAAKDCSGIECGLDKVCGISCGDCPAGKVCSQGKCVCKPNCASKECGSDGCGGSCGSCSSGYSCVSGKCECQKDCSGKNCGSDGCGGSCGTCSSGYSCKEGVCKSTSSGGGGSGPQIGGVGGGATGADSCPSSDLRKNCSANEYCFYIDSSLETGVGYCLNKDWYIPASLPKCSNSDGCDKCSECMVTKANGVCPNDCYCIKACYGGCSSELTCEKVFTDTEKLGACLLVEAGSLYIPSEAREVVDCEECGNSLPETCISSTEGKNFCIDLCTP